MKEILNKLWMSVKQMFIKTPKQDPLKDYQEEINKMIDEGGPVPTEDSDS